MAATPEQKREYWRRYSEANREQLRERSRQYKHENRERILARRRELYAQNAEQHRQAMRERRAANPDKKPTTEQIRQAHEKYRSSEQNRGREREKERARYARNPEKWKASTQRYFENNPQAVEKQKSKVREWRRTNKEKLRLYNADRRARKIQATPQWLTEEQGREIYSIYKKADLLGLTVDHIVPLKGKRVCGLHVPWNLQLLSGIDNSRKGNTLP